MDGNFETVRRAPLSFHEACARYGVTPRALRHYEALEILSPLRVGPDKIFDARQQVRIELVLKGREFRLKLEEIRQIIELYDSDGPEAQAARWREELSRQSRRLRAERDLLDRTIARIDAEALDA